jgi:hypothetical protein
MKKQTTATPATTKNFCAQISSELAEKIEALAAQSGLTSKAETLNFLLVQALQNMQKAATPDALRCENFPYILECYITDALTKNAQISKQAAQDFIADKTGKAKKINVATIDSVLSFYFDEIAAHGKAHGYSENIRFANLLAALKTAKEKREAGAKD